MTIREQTSKYSSYIESQFHSINIYLEEIQASSDESFQIPLDGTLRIYLKVTDISKIFLWAGTHPQPAGIFARINNKIITNHHWKKQKVSMSYVPVLSDPVRSFVIIYIFRVFFAKCPPPPPLCNCSLIDPLRCQRIDFVAIS